MFLYNEVQNADMVDLEIIFHEFVIVKCEL